MTLFHRKRLLSSDSARDGELRAALKTDGAMRADSSRSSDSTAGDAGDGGGGGLATNHGGVPTPAGGSRDTSSQHSASDEDPTILMCGCLGPAGEASLLRHMIPRHDGAQKLIACIGISAGIMLAPRACFPGWMRHNEPDHAARIHVTSEEANMIPRLHGLLCSTVHAGSLHTAG